MLEKDWSFIEINILFLNVHFGTNIYNILSIVTSTFECREMSYWRSEMYIE